MDPDLGRQGHLHLLCGKMASGKSTLAEHLARDLAGVLLSEDAWLARLFPGEVVDIDSYVRHAGRVMAALHEYLVSLLRRNVVVVLDFPANTVEQLARLVGIATAAGVGHTLHYLACDDELCLTRLAQRRVQQPERASTDTDAMFHAVTQYFQVPEEEASASSIIRYRVTSDAVTAETPSATPSATSSAVSAGSRAASAVGSSDVSRDESQASPIQSSVTKKGVALGYSDRHLWRLLAQNARGWGDLSDFIEFDVIAQGGE